MGSDLKSTTKTDIPDQWTFRSKNVATTFNAHVREQLPWYDIATRAVGLIGRHYIPVGGLVYDVGCSTGNIQRELRDVLLARKARFVGVEESPDMVAAYSPSLANEGLIACADALTFPFERYDFAVAFLSIMFFPVAHRKEWYRNMVNLIKPGGAFVVVDKMTTPSGYVGTCLRRLAMSWKLDAGASPEDILKKELSLAGYQRPINPHMFEGEASMFFQIGEFAGWIIERRE